MLRGPSDPRIGRASDVSVRDSRRRCEAGPSPSPPDFETPATRTRCPREVLRLEETTADPCTDCRHILRAQLHPRPAAEPDDVVRPPLGHVLRGGLRRQIEPGVEPVSYTHLRAHETRHDLVCRLLLEKKKKKKKKQLILMNEIKKKKMTKKKINQR